MTAACRITVPTGGTWSPTDGPTAGITQPPVYDGPCRVQGLAGGDQDADAAGQTVAEHPYLVGIDHAAAPIPDAARVEITECEDDPHLVGKILTVAEVQYGSMRFQRNLLCDLDPANQPGA